MSQNTNLVPDSTETQLHILREQLRIEILLKKFIENTIDSKLTILKSYLKLLIEKYNQNSILLDMYKKFETYDYVDNNGYDRVFKLKIQTHIWDAIDVNEFIYSLKIKDIVDEKMLIDLKSILSIYE